MLADLFDRRVAIGEYFKLFVELGGSLTDVGEDVKFFE
jgi:hypothetical protein